MSGQTAKLVVQLVFTEFVYKSSKTYWIAILFLAFNFLRCFPYSCHLPSPLYVLYSLTFETALLHALTVALIVHCGKQDILASKM